ncbi:Midasin [Nymphon striatum]|nr:Midasin [Nymphon striatum]
MASSNARYDNVDNVDNVSDTLSSSSEISEDEIDLSSCEDYCEEIGDGKGLVTESSVENNSKQEESKSIKSSDDHSLATGDEKPQKVDIVDHDCSTSDVQDANSKTRAKQYQHITDQVNHHDAEAVDVATEKQAQEKPVPSMNEEDTTEDFNNEDLKPNDEDEEAQTMEVDKFHSKDISKSDNKMQSNAMNNTDGDKNETTTENEELMDVDNPYVNIDRDTKEIASSIHTQYALLNDDEENCDSRMDQLLRDLDEKLSSTNLACQNQSVNSMKEALKQWMQYEHETTSLVQELCEQLRLVLEPSLASKLKGDYRTGKRLNMRKIIPYIASQFRQDKIWLRRTKPSKRNYQIMLAVDDSSSMSDNQSKTLAFQSIAVISKALNLLEAGEISVLSFGEEIRLLHSFDKQFTDVSGAEILNNFTFAQTKTKIGELLDFVTPLMVKSRHQANQGHSATETSQLLLIISDGRGLFYEGKKKVNAAIRFAKQNNIFMVFIVLDNPNNKDSILDIRVPVFKGSDQIPEIKSYMDSFPFPFYLILRDIQAMPRVLSEALRQWFELVTKEK